MEVRLLFGCIATLCAAGAAYLAFFSVRTMVLRRRAAMLDEDGSSPIQRVVGWYARNGVTLLLPVADAALRVRRVRVAAHEIAQILGERYGLVYERAIVSVFMLVACSASLAAGLVARSVVSALAVFACLAVGVFLVASSSAEKRKEQVQAEVPVAIESLSACFGAGYSLLQTFGQVAQDVTGPLSRTFERASRVLELGGTVDQALAGLRRDAHSSELAFLAVALDVQHQAGGSMRQVLDAVATAAKGEVELKRALRVQTAQAKLSARIVAVMPLLLVTAFSLMSPTFLLPFFASPLGYALLICAIAMQVSGIFLVHRALHVEVE